ncbi:MAG TPA: TIGR02587 family membrane protein [Pyrinomonadaceae bacterium]|nr:TIGR02587 family membrane protein [Pyrinomonadaceae bacterium]
MTRRTSNRSRVRPVRQSLMEYGRGVAGGLIFSLPLLYTMEVWWAGFGAHPWRLIIYVAATFVLLLGYNRYAGVRRDASMTEVAIDSVEELGLGLVLGALALWLLGRVTGEMSASEIVGRIVIEAMVVAIGVSVGTSQLGGDADEGMGEPTRAEAGATDRREHEEIHFSGQLVIALCGAVLFAANVAPTEEVVLIAAEISPWRTLGLALFSLTLGALVLYFSEFRGAERFVPGGSNAVSIFVGTVITYAAGLLVSALVLWFFGRFDGQAIAMCLTQTVVLGVPATLGASAGRLLLQ